MGHISTTFIPQSALFGLSLSNSLGLNWINKLIPIYWNRHVEYRCKLIIAISVSQFKVQFLRFLSPKNINLLINICGQDFDRLSLAWLVSVIFASNVKLGQLNLSWHILSIIAFTFLLIKIEYLDIVDVFHDVNYCGYLVFCFLLPFLWPIILLIHIQKRIRIHFPLLIKELKTELIQFNKSNNIKSN